MLELGRGEALQRGGGGGGRGGDCRGGALEGEEGHCGSINRTATRPQSVILEPEGQ